MWQWFKEHKGRKQVAGIGHVEKPIISINSVRIEERVLAKDLNSPLDVL
jgi:hypothetical protein